MTTTVDIVNRALQAIGTRTTVTADELLNNSTNEAIQANLILGDVRDDLTRMAPWNCSTTAANLTLLSALPGTPQNPGAYNGVWAPGLPLPPWTYAYAYPDDCLRVLYIIPQATPAAAVPIFPVATGFPPTYDGPPVKFRVAVDKYLAAGATPGNPAGTGGPLIDQRVVLTNQPTACVMYCHRVTDPNVMDTLFTSAWSDILAAKLCAALTGDKNMMKALIESANRSIAEARATDGNEDTAVNDVTPDFSRPRGFGADPLWFGGFNWGPLWPTV